MRNDGRRSLARRWNLWSSVCAGSIACFGCSGKGDEEAELSPDSCPEGGEWDASSAVLEEEVLELVNAQRSLGATCDGQSFGPTGPLAMDAALQCAARLHSQDMADNDYFSHDSQDGTSPFERMEKVGFTGFASGENIAAGQATAADVMASWMDSGGHCSNIMNPDTTHIGVGYVAGGDFGHLWTQTFGVID